MVGARRASTRSRASISTIERGRLRGHHGAFGVGQVDGDEHHRLPRHAERRPPQLRRHRRRPARPRQPRRAAQSHIGFVFQGYNLLPRTTAAENVELPLDLSRGAGARSGASRALAALAEVGLAGREHHKPSELSGGQQQRVAIARAIVTRPTLLVADEPTGNLDSARSHEIMTLIAELNAGHGLTVVMVTHEPDIAAYAQRTVGFMDGHVQSDTAAREAA